ncbi:hypothetical protein NMY22_g12814 [Coprinellus aureogranulatus]|nr:hypothetical protein NMY22_g12814 [Coprinellus aureogranulatus]
MTRETALPDIGSCTLDPSVPRETDVESRTPSALNPRSDVESCTPSVPPPDMDSESVPEAPPPTYSQARCHAVYGSMSPPADTGDPKENSLTIRWNPSGNNEPYLPPLPSAASPSATSPTAAPGQTDVVRPQAEARHPESQVPKVPEFREAISKFERAHSDIQAYATAICDITKEMHGLKDTMFSIQEFWMDNGQQELAHGVLPILDLTAKALPTFAFPPRLNTAPLYGCTDHGGDLALNFGGPVAGVRLASMGLPPSRLFSRRVPTGVQDFQLWHFPARGLAGEVKEGLPGSPRLMAASATKDFLNGVVVGGTGTDASGEGRGWDCARDQEGSFMDLCLSRESEGRRCRRAVDCNVFLTKRGGKHNERGLHTTRCLWQERHWTKRDDVGELTRLLVCRSMRRNAEHGHQEGHWNGREMRSSVSSFSPDQSIGGRPMQKAAIQITHPRNPSGIYRRHWDEA